jgi:hypothetical protein
MSLRANPVRAKAVLGALLLTLVAGAAACEEDGKTAPERCIDPPPFDIQAGAPADNVTNPCATPVGHSVSFIGSPTTPTAGTSTGGKGGKATTNGGAGGAGGAP